MHSRIKRLVFGASDYKTGAVGSRFHFFDDYKMNHTLEITSGVLAEKCGQKFKRLRYILFYLKIKNLEKKFKEKIRRPKRSPNLKITDCFERSQSQIEQL